MASVFDNLKSNYENFWKDNKDPFEKRTVDITKNDKRYIMQRDAENKNVIPYIEIFKSNKEIKERGLLIVGLNPAGTDMEYYKDKNKEKKEIIFYEKESFDSGYLKVIDDFSKNTKYKENYSVLDLFCIVQKSQTVLEKDLIGKAGYYKDMFGYFVKAVKEIQPETIVFANAFITKLITNGLYKNKPSAYKTVINGHIEFCNFCKEKGLYNLKFKNDEREYNAHFCSMLSGQRALDLARRQNLEWQLGGWRQ